MLIRAESDSKCYRCLERGRPVICTTCFDELTEDMESRIAAEVERVKAMEARLAVLERVLEERDYDPGLLNNYGGGNVSWWLDYIRSEVDSCNRYWRELLAAALAEAEAQ